MKLYEFTPKKNVNKLGLITGILIIGAAAILLATVLLSGIPYRWIAQLTGIGMLTAGVFITSRYIMKSYVYAVIPSDDGSEDFTVTEIQGRHTITVCRIGMSGVESVHVVNKSDAEKRKELKDKIKADKRKKFNYCADFLEQKYICILCEECGERFAINLSWDQSLEELFS